MCLTGKGFPSRVLEVDLKVMVTQHFGCIKCYLIIHLKMANFVIEFHLNKNIYTKMLKRNLNYMHFLWLLQN